MDQETEEEKVTEITREEQLRDGGSVIKLAQSMIEDLTGQRVVAPIANDIAGEMEQPRRPVKYPYRRVKAERTRLRMRAAKLRKLKQTETDEKRLSALKVKLQAGDPNDPMYKRRLAAAKKTVAMATSLPVIARQKWANPEFQKEMEEKGHTYNPALYKGWLPFEVAKRIQKELIGARSRGEYEFLVKLYELRFLPCRPDSVYAEEWAGWSDFLGTVNVFAVTGARQAPIKLEEYRPFYEALTFARSMKIATLKQWRVACKDGRIPLDVPMDPHKVYSDQFVSWDHWLGTNTALDKVTGKVVVPDIWVLYRDGRDDAFWWAKMSADKYSAFAQTPEIAIERAYQFEGELANQVWDIIDKLSEPYENDKRERFIENPQSFGIIKSELDNILKWSNV